MLNPQRMDMHTYERIRASRPDLSLPSWRDLRRTDKKRARHLNPDQLIARRTGKLLAREPGTLDIWREDDPINYLGMLVEKPI